MKRASAMFAAAVLALAGCSGEDGAPGAAGTDGTDGTSCSVVTNQDGSATITCTGQPPVTITNGTNGVDGQGCTLSMGSDGTRTVTCANGTVVLPAVVYSGKVLVTDQVATTEGADVVVTFKVTLNGAPTGLFTNKYRAYRHAAGSGASAGSFVRTSISDVTTFTVSYDAATSKYTARFPGMATTVGTTPTTFMITLNTGAAEPAATVVAHLGGAPKSTVSDQACINCHGDLVFREGHHDNNPQGVGGCVVCHVRADSSESRLGTSTNLTTGVVGTAPGTRLMGYVHGIHNSHNMPAGSITGNIDPDGSSGPLPSEGPFTVAKPEGVYARNNSLRFASGTYPPGVPEISSPFSIGFPSYMNNCSTCHDTQENLDYVLAKPFTFQTCISCHDGWAGFGVANTGTPAAPIYLLGGSSTNHANFTAVTDCSICHAGSTVGSVHNGGLTERSGLIWAGKDQSIEEGKKVSMEITGITRDDAQTPSRLVITWTAKNPATGASYDPCNSDYTVGPVFFGKTGLPSTCTNTAAGCSSNLSILRAYAQGDDWVSAGVGSSPGQPGSAVNVVVPNADPLIFTSGQTTCDANVATTLVNVETTTATKATLAIQGKPQVKFTNGNVIWVRAKSPTREFVVATGAEPTDKRRAIADTEKCLSCHQGSLYQHGGNRIDNVDLCVMCHNPASNEKNGRVNMGVDATESYDGKPGQTYDLRYMLHAVHSAGETNAPLVYYRTNGIYAFGSQAAIDGLPNWPGAGCFDVYGSSRSQSASGGTSTGTQCGTPAPAAGEGIPSKKNHNEIVVHYPRALNDCAACHTSDAGTVPLPSPTIAVAVTTYDAGNTPWSVQTDDVLMSPATASCMSCHQSGDATTQLGIRTHAFQNSWFPRTFTNGRDDVLGGSVGESCLMCHGAGADADYNAAHGQ